LPDPKLQKARHLFVPYVPFRVSIFPQGDSRPSYLEQAVLFLIEGHDRDGTPMRIDQLIYSLALGEPTGRELINGLWRKGWLIIDASRNILTLSMMMKARFEANPEQPDFENLGTGSAPFMAQCFYDLIDGKAFTVSQDRLADRGSPPFVIEPFFPESDTAPFGRPLTGFLDLPQKQLVDVLRTHEGFQQSLFSSAEVKLQVLPPDQPYTQADIRFLRLFFHVDRDRNDRLSLRSAEDTKPILAQLANFVGPHIAERVLNAETQLKKRFLGEVPVTDVRPQRVANGAAAQVHRAIDKFDSVVDAARSSDILGLYHEARQTALLALLGIEAGMVEVASRQVQVKCLSDRSEVNSKLERMLHVFRRQAMLTATTFTDGALIGRVETVSRNKSQGRLLAQLGGSQSDKQSRDMRNRLRTRQNFRETGDVGSVEVSFAFPTVNDPSVAAEVLVADADALLISSTSLLSDHKASATGFYLELMSPAHEVKDSFGAVLANAALDLIDAAYPTFGKPAPLRKLDLRGTPGQTVDTDLRDRIRAMIEEMDQEADAMSRGFSDDERGRQQLRDLARLRLEELRSLESLVKGYESRAPVTAHGVGEGAIFATACALVQEHQPDRPIYIGLGGQEPPDDEFVEVIETLMGERDGQETHVIFLDTPCREWERQANTMAAKFAPRLRVTTIRRAVLPFIIASSGCLAASGGIDRRLFSGVRRTDKTHLGIELKGKDCQEAFLELLDKVLKVQPARLEDLQPSHVAGTPGKLEVLPSMIYRRWLTATDNSGFGGEKAANVPDLGVDSLRAALEKNPECLDLCLGDAERLGDLDYGYALRKAAVLAGLRPRDTLATWLWDHGALFEASILAEAPPQGHPLADAALRQFVQLIIAGRALPSHLTAASSWFANPQVLALAGLGILSPATRASILLLVDGLIPATPLGGFVRALGELARDTPDGPLTWTATDEEQLGYGPEVCFDRLQNAIAGFDRDRGNRETNGVQLMLRRDLTPLRAMVLQQASTGKDRAATFSAAAEILKATYGAGFLDALATNGRRTQVATQAIDEANVASRRRPEGQLLEPFLGPKREHMIKSVARLLELLRAAAIFSGAVKPGTQSPQKSAVAKAGRLWLATTEVHPHFGLPLALLREAAREEGRAFPDGYPDYRLWRHPMLLADLQDRGGAPRLSPGAILDEEWPLGVDAQNVFRSLLRQRRFVTADIMLRLLEDHVGQRSNLEEESRVADMRLILETQVADTARHYIERAQELIRDGMQLGLQDLAEQGRELHNLYSVFELSPRDVEEFERLLAPLEQSIHPVTPLALTKALESDSIAVDATLKAILSDDQFGPWRRRLAFARYLACVPATCAPQPPEFARDRGYLRRSLQKLDLSGGMDLRKVITKLDLPDVQRIRDFLEAAGFALSRQGNATSLQALRFVQALEALLSPGEPPEVQIGELDFQSESALVHCPHGALAAWMDWQLPSSQLRILVGEQGEMKTLGDLGLSPDPIPVLINPFLSSPSIIGRHVMLNLVDILSAMTMRSQRTASALFAAAMAQGSFDLILPQVTDTAAIRPHLERLTGRGAGDMAQRLPPERFHAVVARLMERLWVEFRLVQSDPLRQLKKSDAAELAPKGLAFLAGGWVEDAAELLREARRRSQGHYRPDAALIFSTPHLDALAAASFQRWRQMRTTKTLPEVPSRLASRACRAIWTADPTTRTLVEFAHHVGLILECEDEALCAELCSWMRDEDILSETGGDSFIPSRIHPFATLPS
jgi:hypothetical protein